MPPDKLAVYLCFDPRDPTQRVDDRTTWKLSDNAILITATMLLALDSDRMAIDWDKVAALADLCEDPEFCPAAGLRTARLATRDETDAMLFAALSRPRRKARLRPDAGCATRRVRRKYGI
jgi:hypothetical protein